VIGSTVKPLTFASMASQLHGVADLGDLVVIEREAVHRDLGGVPLAKETAPYGPVGAHRMDSYLINSRTWPAVVIGALGLVPSKERLHELLVPAESSADLMLGRRYQLDLLRPRDRVFAQDELAKRYVMRPNAGETILFQGLGSLYEVEVSGTGAARSDSEAYRRRLETYLPTFLPKEGTATPRAFEKVLPEIVRFDTARMRDPRQDLVTFLIGGGQCLWTNVAMAESFAGLSTGIRVRARLEAREDSEPGEPLPLPLGDPEWRERHLLGPLERVRTSGTARSMRTSFGSYRALMKTGTLGEEVDSESLMFTIGAVDDKGQFVRGETVSGYLFMRDSNLGGRMLKFQLADRLLPIVVEYLGEG
jgi:hypothetical protein